MIILGRQIRAARALLKMTRATLAKRAGLSEPALTAIENEKSDPKASSLDSISRALRDAGITWVENSNENGPGCYLRDPLPPWKG
jgi:transcriptional regulator with XRE-family HTH domain